MIGGNHKKRVRRRQQHVAGGAHRHTIIDEENDENEGFPCPKLNAVHTLVLLLSLTVVFSWASFCFMEHSVISHANVVLLRALQTRCHALILSADETATHASHLIRTHKNFIKGKIKAMASSVATNSQYNPEKTIASPPALSSSLAVEFAAIYNLPALARNVETELQSQTQIFGSQPLTVVFHKANTVGQMPFGTITWEDYFLHYPSSPTVTTNTTIDTSQKRMISSRTTSSSSTTTVAPSYFIHSTPSNRLLSDVQVDPIALTARAIKGTTHPYAHLFNDIVTEGDYYVYNHTDKAPCEIHTISYKQNPTCRWDSLQGKSIIRRDTNTAPYPCI